MGKRWTTTSDQLQWLRNRLPRYHEAQKNKTVDRFYTECLSAWFEGFKMRLECFPDKPEAEPLTAEEQKVIDTAISKRKKQILWWFQWNGNPARHSDKKDVSKFIAALGIDKKAKRKGRKPQRVEAYQKLYTQKIKDAVDAEAEKRGLTTGREKMKVRRELTQTLLDGESPEVQKAVDDMIQTWEVEREKELQEAAAEEEPHERTAEDYHSAVIALPEVLKSALKACSEVTGWVIQVVAAGPYGLANGDIWRQEYYFGPTNAAGCTFREAYADFDKNFYHPFSRHVHNCFPPDVRAARVINNATEGNTDVEAADIASQTSDLLPASEPPRDDATSQQTPSAPAISAVGGMAASDAPEVPSDNEDDDDEEFESLASLVASISKDAQPPLGESLARLMVNVQAQAITPASARPEPVITASPNSGVAPSAEAQPPANASDQGHPTPPQTHPAHTPLWIAPALGPLAPTLIQEQTLANTLDQRAIVPHPAPTAPSPWVAPSTVPLDPVLMSQAQPTANPPVASPTVPLDPVLMPRAQPTANPSDQVESLPPWTVPPPISSSVPNHVGAPSEPIEFAFARMRGEDPGLHGSRHPMDIIHLGVESDNTSDYTVSGARISVPFQPDPTGPAIPSHPTPILINSNASTVGTSVELDGQNTSNPALEQGRRSSEGKRLKRKQDEIENTPIAEGNQRAKRTIRPPKRPDASPEKRVTADQEPKQAKKKKTVRK